MADWELIENRTLSGKGILKVPSGSKKNRAYILYSDVVRDSSNPYLNLNWNPPRSRYGTLVFLRSGYVVASESIEFEHQCYDGINDISGQTLLALKCAHNAVMQTLFNLGTALNTNPTPGSNIIAAYENMQLAWDEVRFKAYADTALQLRLYRLKYDVCNADFDDDKPPAPIPPQISKVPIGTPVPNTAPYVPNGGDSNNSIPFPGDEPAPPEPLGNICQAYTLKFSYTYSQDGAAPQTAEHATAVYAPVSQEFRKKAGQIGVIETQHRGNPTIMGCGNYQYRDILSAGGNREILSWDNIRLE